MTASRHELKYLVPDFDSSRLCRTIDSQLARQLPHKLPGTQLPGIGAQDCHNPQLILTTYFDTPNRDIFREAVSGYTRTTKLRLREYHELQATTRGRPPILCAPEDVWFEIKESSGPKVRKKRLKVSWRTAQGLIHGGGIAPESPFLNRSNEGDFSLRLKELKDRWSERLVAQCAVSYWRRAWHSDDGLLRLTLDTSLRFFRPTALASAPFDSCNQLREHALPQASFLGSVLEVKSLNSPVPQWLTQSLKELGSPQSKFSKFAAASRAVHL